MLLGKGRGYSYSWLGLIKVQFILAAFRNCSVVSRCSNKRSCPAVCSNLFGRKTKNNYYCAGGEDFWSDSVLRYPLELFIKRSDFLDKPGKPKASNRQ